MRSESSAAELIAGREVTHDLYKQKTRSYSVCIRFEWVLGALYAQAPWDEDLNDVLFCDSTIYYYYDEKSILFCTRLNAHTSTIVLLLFIVDRFKIHNFRY